jgi:alkylhydroperoxidase family enzyme
MPRVPEAAGAEGTPFYRIMGYHPTILEKFVAMRDAYWEEGVLDHSLKELVRMLSARLNSCDH